MTTSYLAIASARPGKKDTYQAQADFLQKEINKVDITSALEAVQKIQDSFSSYKTIMENLSLIED